MWRADLPTVTVGEPRHLRARGHRHAAPARTCTPAATAAASPTRCTRSPRSSRACTTPSGRVAVAGFYDGVARARPEQLRDAIRAMPSTSAPISPASAPASRRWARTGYTLLERQWLRPTLEFNGIWGGYQGRAPRRSSRPPPSAKITCRLVPGQDPAGVAAADRRPPRSATARAACAVEVAADEATAAAPTPSTRRTRRWRARRATCWSELYGRAPLRVRMGATLPIGRAVPARARARHGVLQFATADEDYHAPNEFFRLSSLDQGLVAWARYLRRLGA